MSLITHEFDKYILTYYTPESSPTVASIHCYLGTSHKGTITFMQSGSDLGGGDAVIVGNRIMLSFHEEHFANIMDIVRNETPLYLKYHQTKGRGWLNTSYEDVGEEES